MHTRPSCRSGSTRMMRSFTSPFATTESEERAPDQDRGSPVSETAWILAEEEEEGEPLDQKLAEERPSKPPFDSTLAIEDVDAPDDEPEMVGQATIGHDPFVAPEEAAMTVSEGAPGAVDHPDAHDDVERDDESSEEA